ncbi:MAG: MBL fold metallo-hydrolase, partial [Planctomycetota bacterium]
MSRSSLFRVLLCTLLWAAGISAQPGDPVAPPRGLEVVFLDVGQGDSTILVGPSGSALVFDGGFDGEGTRTVLPALKRLGVKQVQAVLASHYHPDHVGGLDELLNGFPVLSVWDRGRNREPTHRFYKAYVSAAGRKRRTAFPGQVFFLGGGAKATVLAVDGNVFGDKQYPIHTGQQVENAASIVLRVDYGNFQLWLGGDLTGGGNSTYDMETPVARVCGDVDVYQVDHHGSNTSSNATMLRLLSPELALISAGLRNPFGHPTTKVLNRLNSSAVSRLTVGTSAGASGWQGFTVGGTVTLRTDGWRYRVEDSAGTGLDLYTDDVRVTPSAPGSLLISELHRLPSNTKGAYLELHCKGPMPVNLRGLKISGNLGSFTLAPAYRLLPGDRFLTQAHGDPATNGGIPFGHTWPYAALKLGTSFDTLALDAGTTRLDSLAYKSGFSGGPGQAAERIDLEGPSLASNFKGASARYGRGDLGTPGGKNSVDATRFALRAGLEVLGASSPGGAALHLIASAPSDPGRLHAMPLSFGTSPGLTVSGVHIPLNWDRLFSLTLGLPGFVAV